MARTVEPGEPRGIVESTPLTRLLSARRAKEFSDLKGIETVGDLLEYRPKGYLDQGELSDFRSLTVGEQATVIAKVLEAHLVKMRSRRGSLFTATLGDGRGGRLKVTFFKPFGHVDKLRPGVRAVFNGVVSEFNRERQLTHPDYALLEEEDGDSGLARYLGYLLPIYVESGPLRSSLIRSAMMVCLDATNIAEPVPAEMYAGRGLIGHREALWAVQRPATHAEKERGLKRLRYDEALTLQVIMAQRRRRAAAVATPPVTERGDGILAAFDARLPFQLTDGQRAVAAEIAGDLMAGSAMQRLLQGEVGSGKTVVALRAMLAAVDAGRQAALLAPTEVLAAQHFRSITTLLGDLAMGGLFGGASEGTTVVLLTGSQSTASRRQALAHVASGAAGIVIGTHALIQRKVDFADLGLVVVDEQHRFGVEQRDALRDKADAPPHTLVMTATPIPRTVAMTVFGDLDVSTLRDIPRGRQPISTHVVDESLPGWVDRTWARTAEEVRRGHQVFVVCPKIGDECADSAAAEEEAEWLDPQGGEVTEGRMSRPEARGVYAVAADLQSRPALAGLRIAILHGRLDSETRDATMRAFTAGEIDILVATTVIEVGVDVPNATMMIVIDADRFGVSQLHQLRGRVGRGAAAGLCLLATRSTDERTRSRLDAVAATADGFELAQLDLEQRREGDILGARQSGRSSSLRFLRITHRDDEEIIAWAREDAHAIVAADPDLTAYPALRERVATRLDAEQAAYLERG